MNHEDWVVVIETNGMTLAQMYANQLTAAGIPAHPVAEGGGNTFGLTVGKLGTAAVLVPPDRLEEAQEMLEVELLPDSDDIVSCPNCSADVELDDQEWEQNWFVCPSCGERVDLEEVDSEL